MLKIQAILITGLFAFLLMKPVFPYLDYLARRSYIIEKFCENKDKPEMACNGKCHLNEKVRENESSSESDQIPVSKRQWKQPEFLLGTWHNDLFLSEQLASGTSYINYYEYQYSESVFHPPV